MKILIAAMLCLSAICLLAFADEVDVIVLDLEDVSTNATPTTATTPITRGYLSAVIVDLKTAGTTCDVAIVTHTNAVDTYEETFLSVSSITTDTPYYPVLTQHTYDGVLTNSAARPLAAYEQLVAEVSNCNATNKDVRITLKIVR